MTEEEKIAEEYFKTTYPSYIGFDTFTRDIEDAVIYGLKARTKWHRVADGDLPPFETGGCSIDVLIDRGKFAYYYYDDNCWFDSDDMIDRINPPKAWCEIPKYTEEEEE